MRPFPVGNSGEIRAFAEGCSISGWSGSVGLAIIAGSTGAENPEKAYRFIEFIYGPDGQLAQAALGYNIPAQMELANTDAFLQPGQMPANSQIFLETARCQLPGPWSFVPHWFVWQPEPWGRMWQAVIVENSAFAEDALLDVAGDLQARPRRRLGHHRSNSAWAASHCTYSRAGAAGVPARLSLQHETLIR